MSRASLLAVTSLTLDLLILGGGALAFTGLALAGCAQSGANRSAVIRCTPGERVDVSCGCWGLGQTCTGFPGIRLCDATLDHGACGDAQAVTIADRMDYCGDYSNDEPDCPLATTLCPSSGMLAVSTFATPDYSGATASYACRWEVRRAPLSPGPTTTFTCAPGELVRASCGCEGLGRACEGTPYMRACTPGSACADSSTSLDSSSYACGSCPLVEASCPTSGAIVIATNSSSSYRCDVSAIGSESGVLRASGI